MNRLIYVSLTSLVASSLAMTSGCASSAKATSPEQSHHHADEAKVAPVKNPQALEELKKMGEALAAAKTMSFEASTMTPIRGANNQWVHVFSTAKVAMQRPDKIAIETGGDAFAQKIIYDGKMFSTIAPHEKLFSQLPMSGPIDSMLSQASSKAGDNFSFADVLIADPLTSWTTDLEGAAYIGESSRNGEKLQHLALTAKDVDWEVWVDENTHLPRVVYVKYTGETRSPTVMIEFSHWKINSKIASSAFNPKVPAGFKKIEVKTPELSEGNTQ